MCIISNPVTESFYHFQLNTTIPASYYQYTVDFTFTHAPRHQALCLLRILRLVMQVMVKNYKNIKIKRSMTPAQARPMRAAYQLA